MADYDALQDPQFLKAPRVKQFSYLMGTDAEFAKAPPAQQQAYLDHIGTLRTTSDVSAAPATGMSAGPGWVGRKVNEVKAGLAGAQEGGGLKEQPTKLGNAAEALGMVGEMVSQLAPGDLTAELAGNATQMLPSARLAKAKEVFQGISKGIGEKTVTLTNAMKDALDAVKEEKALGGGGGAIADTVMNRLLNSDGPLTFDDARRLYHNIGDLTSSDRMASNKNMVRLLNNFKSTLADSIQATADTAGSYWGTVQKKAMSEFAKASTQQERLDTIIEWAKKNGIKAIGTTALGGLAHEGWKLHQLLFGDEK